jgi:uncharacterized pyridoxamine 5'-phosphate oxidase family protein
MKLPKEVVDFLKEQSFVIVSTLDKKSYIHNACKGIVAIKNDEIYLLDLYQKNTYENLKRNPTISITAVDELKFKGFCLKGKAKIVESKNIAPEIIKAIQGQKAHSSHPEASLPEPKYLIKMKVEEIINLTGG